MTRPPYAPNNARTAAAHSAGVHLHALALMLSGIACYGGTASAQSMSGLIIPAISPDYNQGRNVSILEKPRPDYDPLGARLGSFMIYPRLNLGVAVSDNVYLSPASKTGDGFATIAPALQIQSDWNRHQVQLSSDANFRRYFSEKPLNQDQWNVRGSGLLDVGDYGTVKLEAQTSRLREEPFTSQLDAPIAILSSYRRTYFDIQGERQFGRTRFTLSYDVTSLAFSDIDLASGVRQSQRDRDRRVNSFAGQAEYSLTPGAVLFAQLSYSDTVYDQPLFNGAANRNSKSWRILSGINIDLPGYLRGTIGIGYMQRDFDSPIYGSVNGLSIDAEMTYFMTQQTNLKFAARRMIEDSAIADNGAFVSTIFSAGVDQEILNNLLAGFSVVYGTQDYIRSPFQSSSFQTSAFARYLISRRVSMRLDAAYGRRKQDQNSTKFNIQESSALMTLELHP